MKKHKKLLYVVIGIMVIGIVVLITTKRSNPSKSDTKNSPITVNGMHISQDVVKAEEKKAALFKQWLLKEKIKDATSDVNSEDTRNTIVEQLLAQEYARKQGIIVTQKEIEKQYIKAATSIGGEEKYIAKLKEIYGVDKAGVYEMLSYDLLKQKISQKVQLPFEVWVKEEKARAKIDIRTDK